MALNLSSSINISPPPGSAFSANLGGDVLVSKSGDAGINLNSTTTNGVAVTRYGTTATGNLWATGINITNSDSRWELYNFGLASSPLIISSGGQVTISEGQTGGYVSKSLGFTNANLTITENRTSYFVHKNTGSSNGSSSSIFNITGVSTVNGTFLDINLRVQKDATTSAINTTAYLYVHGSDMLGAVQVSGTSAVTTNRTVRVVRVNDQWVIIGGIGTY
jgi:hypothetical protein